MSDQFDCIVVGSGPGGYVAAIRAAQLGMRTAVIEREEAIGGRCLNWACIPAKTVLRSADLLTEVLEAGTFGIKVDNPRVDFSLVADRRRTVIKGLGLGVAGLLKKNRVEVVKGEGSLGPSGNVIVADRSLSASTATILATGSVRRTPPGIDFGDGVIGTEEAWAFDSLPGSLAVVGGRGASGVEIASAYARLGAKVQLFEFFDRVLPTEDGDVSKVAMSEFEDQGIEVHVSTRLENVYSSPDGVQFEFGEHKGSAQWLVVATGRQADVAALGLDRAGVATAASGLVEVDDHLRTSVANIYAIGDLVAGPALAHKASEEGIIAVETAAGIRVGGINHGDIPRATFCKPNIGSFGLTEEAARSLGHDVVVGKAPFRAVGAGTIYDERRGFIKIVGERKYGEILGAHIVGARATELIQQLLNFKILEGGYPELARVVHGHPTLSEAILEAARNADGWIIHG